MKNKNNIDLYYIAFKLITEFPDVTPKQFEGLFELMSDWELLSEDGKNVGKLIFNQVWSDEM